MSLFQKPLFRAVLVSAVCACLLVFGLLTLSHAGPAPKADSTVQELESLVQTIEDEERRKVLLDQLQALIEARRATENEQAALQKPAREAGAAQLSEAVFSRFEDAMERIAASARETGHMLSNTPAHLKEARAYLSRPQQREGILRLLAVALGAFIVALVFRLLLRRRMPKPPPAGSPWPVRTASSARAGMLHALPSGLGLLSLFLFFRYLPCPAPGRAILFHLFIVLFGYRVVMETARALLSPEEPGLRILPVQDDGAYYYWVWVRRFANYTALYFLAVGIPALTSFPESPLAFIRGLLLLVFPGMITAFVLQISRDLRMRHAGGPPQKTSTRPGDAKRKRAALRFLPALAIIYAWAFFLILIASREEGMDFIWRATLGTAVTIPALWAGLRLLDWLFDKLFAVHQRIRDRVPGIEERADRYLIIVRKVSAAVLVLIGAGVVAEFWGLPVAAFVASEVGSLILLRGAAIAVTFAVIMTVLQLNRVVSAFLLRERGGRTVSQKTRTLVPMVRAAVNIAAVFVGGVVILGRIGVDTTPILAGAGIVGLAVGFGSQTLVKDLINGLFILFEESIRVGDWAQVGNKDGEVEAVGLRTVRLRDLRGNVHVIPNSAIDSVTNYSKDFSRSVMDIGVAYREDIDQVMDILKELGQELRKDPEFGEHITGPLEVFGLDRFEDSAIIVRIRFNTKPLKQWGVKREFYRRMKRVFDERGIEIPFPHQTLYMGQPKEGKAPPLYVQRVEGPDDSGKP